MTYNQVHITPGLLAGSDGTQQSDEKVPQGNFQDVLMSCLQRGQLGAASGLPSRGRELLGRTRGGSRGEERTERETQKVRGSSWVELQWGRRRGWLKIHEPVRCPSVLLTPAPPLAPTPRRRSWRGEPSSPYPANPPPPSSPICALSRADRSQGGAGQGAAPGTKGTP